MKKTKNTYRNGFISDCDLIAYYNEKKVSYGKYRIVLKSSSVDIINTYTFRVVNVPIIIKCAFDGTDYSFYEFVTGEEYHRRNSKSILLKGEDAGINMTLNNPFVYDSESSLTNKLYRMNDEEKAAYIYGMELLPTIAKDKINSEYINKVKQMNENYLETFVKKYKK